MSASFELKSEQPQPSTQDLPTLPTVVEIDDWDKEKLPRWIQQRKPGLLVEKELAALEKLNFRGSTFLGVNVEVLTQCGLSLLTSAGLQILVNEVLNGKFTAWA
jgi:hypothetical protein